MDQVMVTYVDKGVSGTNKSKEVLKTIKVKQ